MTEQPLGFVGAAHYTQSVREEAYDSHAREEWKTHFGKRR